MAPREVMARALPGNSSEANLPLAEFVIEALTAAGFDLVHRDENHGPTLERAAKVLDVREQTELVVGERHKCGGRHYKAREALHVARIAKSDAAAIRALQAQEGRDG